MSGRGVATCGHQSQTQQRRDSDQPRQAPHDAGQQGELGAADSQQCRVDHQQEGRAHRPGTQQAYEPTGADGCVDAIRQEQRPGHAGDARYDGGDDERGTAQSTSLLRVGPR